MSRSVSRGSRVSLLEGRGGSISSLSKGMFAHSFETSLLMESSELRFF